MTLHFRQFPCCAVRAKRSQPDLVLALLLPGMSVSVTGANSVYYSSESSVSFVSPRLFDILKHSRVSVYGCGLPLTVTAGSFSGVVYFAKDPLCEVDVVIGDDWIKMCRSHGVSPGIDSLPVYRSSVFSRLASHTSLTGCADLLPALLALPEHVALPSGISVFP
jgi:hypothetical protein